MTSNDLCCVWFFFTTAAVSVVEATTSSHHLTLKSRPNLVEFIEFVKLLNDLAKNWFTVANEELQDLLLIFNIVVSLLAKDLLFVLRKQVI